MNGNNVCGENRTEIDFPDCVLFVLKVQRVKFVNIFGTICKT